MAAPQSQTTDKVTDAGTDAATQQYVTFLLADEEYGVDILRVQEIKGWDAVTPLPDTPDYILGVINLRGTIVPVMDLRKRFDLEEIEFGTTTVIIVVRANSESGKERTVGLVMDAVSEVYDVSQEDINPPPDFGNSAAAEFVHGLVTVEDKLLILLNIDRLVDFGVLTSIENNLREEAVTQT